MAEYLHGAYGHLDESVVQRTVTSETVPVYFGTAPVNLVRGYADAGVVNEPVKISSLADARAKVGHASDWGTFTLSEAVAAHFDAVDKDGVGPIYVVNVLDPDVHRSATPTKRALIVAQGRASFPTETAILDTLRVPRDIPDGQSVEVRPKGAAGDVDEFDYPAAYAKAGVKFEGGVISYEPGSGTELVPELMHGDHYYIGLEFPKPDGATSVTASVNGDIVSSAVDLTQDGDEVFGGEYVQYFAFADADGAQMPDSYWLMELEWSGESGPISTTYAGVCRGEGGKYLVEGEDYELDYNANAGSVVITAVDGGGLSDGEHEAEFFEVDDSAIDADTIVGTVTASGEYSGIQALALLYQEQFVVPNLLAAPGWSNLPKVYDALVKASQKVNGHWDAFVFADLPTVDEDGTMVDTIAKAIAWKAENLYTSERSEVCWPMAQDAKGRSFHVSTLAVVETLRVDQEHGGVPFESCSNKPCAVRKQHFGANATNRGFDQQTANGLNAAGVMTVVGWAGEWVLWGPHTAAYSADDPTVDPRAIFAVSMRMLMHVTNVFQQEWGPEIDAPMTRHLKDRIVNREQEKLDSLVTIGALIGKPTVQFLESDNSTSQLMNGDFVWRMSATPTPPLKSATCYVSYTDTGFSAYFEGGE